MTFAAPQYLGNLGGSGGILAVNAHGQNPKAGLPDLVVPNGTGVLQVILNTTK